MQRVPFLSSTYTCIPFLRRYNFFATIAGSPLTAASRQLSTKFDLQAVEAYLFLHHLLGALAQLILEMVFVALCTVIGACERPKATSLTIAHRMSKIDEFSITKQLRVVARHCQKAYLTAFCTC